MVTDRVTDRVIDKITDKITDKKGENRMRLIDADALPITPVDITDLPKDGTALIVYSKENVDNAPTVDTERHGHWFDEEVEEAGGICTYTRCSVCGDYILCDSIGQIIETPYCPWCGAKMDEVEE